MSAIRLLRNIDPRLVQLAGHNDAIRRLVEIATDPVVPDTDRRNAVRTLQAFLVLTPSTAEGWKAEPDSNAPAAWRRRVDAGCPDLGEHQGEYFRGQSGAGLALDLH